MYTIISKYHSKRAEQFRQNTIFLRRNHSH